MKLVYVHSVALPGGAANTVNVAKMCDAFATAGQDIKLIFPGFGPDAGGRAAAAIRAYYGLSNFLRILRLPRLRMGGGARLFAFLASAAARLSGNPLIYTRDIATARAAQWLGLDVVYEAHSALGEQGVNARRDFGLCSRRRTFRRLVVISQALATDFLEQCPWLENKILVAHDGADAMPDTGKAPVKLDGFSVAYAGHLYPGKGMEIIAPLAERCPWAAFHIYGGRPSDLSDWRERLAGLPNITFHGHVPHSKLAELLPRHDVVLAPYQQRVTISDGGKTDVSRWMSPLKLFEYMSFGLPIVCSDLPVLREILRDRETALMCAPDVVEEWERALIRLRDEPELREAIGKQGQREFLAHYTWTKRAEHVLAGLSR